MRRPPRLGVNFPKLHSAVGQAELDLAAGQYYHQPGHVGTRFPVPGATIAGANKRRF